MNQFERNVYSQFSTKKILITGASGFIGSGLANYLCHIGADVHGTSRVKRDGDKENMTWWEGSFEDLDFTRQLLKNIKPEIIFHLSGEVTGATDVKNILPTYHSLLTSTINLLTVATEIGCEKIIVTGSSTEPLDHEPYPNSPYSAAKWATNGYGHLFQKLYQAPVLIVRPFMGYGPGQPQFKLLPSVILTLLAGESPKLSNGLWVTDWIYIEDMVEGLLAAANMPQIDARTIDIGTGVLTSVKALIEEVVDIMQPVGKPLFGALPDRHHEHTRVADIEYTYSKANWKAKTSLREGLKKTIEWFKYNAVAKSYLLLLHLCSGLIKIATNLSGEEEILEVASLYSF